MAAPRTDLPQVLASEADLVKRFVALLQQEKLALTAGATDALPALAEEKDSLAASLNEFSRQRNDYLATHGFAPDRQGMDAWCAKHPGQRDAISAWNLTLSLAAQAKELNNLNGQLVELRMQYNSQALEILRRRENTLDLYGPDGRSTGPGDRKIDDAV